MAAKYFLAFLVACAAVQVIYGFPSFGDIVDKFKDGITEIKNKLLGLLNKISGDAKKVWDDIQKAINDLKNKFGKQVEALKAENNGDNVKQCFNGVKDQIINAEKDAETKLGACMEQVKKDMEPMMDDIKKQMDEVAPKMSEELQTCMQMSNWQQCIEGATSLAPQVKTALQNVFGDAGKIAQMVPTEAKKAMECAAPVKTNLQKELENVITTIKTCIADAVGA